MSDEDIATLLREIPQLSLDVAKFMLSNQSYGSLQKVLEEKQGIVQALGEMAQPFEEEDETGETKESTPAAEEDDDDDEKDDDEEEREGQEEEHNEEEDQEGDAGEDDEAEQKKEYGLTRSSQLSHWGQLKEVLAVEPNFNYGSF